MSKSLTTPLKWDAPQLLALALVFEGRLSQAKIAKKCNIAPRTLAYWIDHPDFQERLEAMRADLAASLLGIAYTGKQQRIVALSLMAESAREEYEARPWLKEVRPTPNGDVTNESFNEGAFAAFRGALDDIAKELGHRKVKDEEEKTQFRVVFVMPKAAEMPTVAAPVVDGDTWPEEPPDGDSHN